MLWRFCDQPRSLEFQRKSSFISKPPNFICAKVSKIETTPAPVFLPWCSGAQTVIAPDARSICQKRAPANPPSPLTKRGSTTLEKKRSMISCLPTIGVRPNGI
ncbi:hypothetical protein CDAR_397891 [Caerostris darwini]|uniref:Uncharacterized protein n=1 Tax=Caerostris darwini TaxID=1538125 RepID=A0AAV4MQF7_9ARAC|nr:hypothetical protein CDAR_397891 [Caerostris darwini]